MFDNSSYPTLTPILLNPQSFGQADASETQVCPKPQPIGYQSEGIIGVKA